MFLRYIKAVMKANSQLQQARESLFSHRTFSVEDAFALLDVNKSGVLSSQELHQVFSDHEIEIDDLDRVVEIADLDEDGTLDFKELSLAITPDNVGAIRREPMYNISLEERKLFQQAWMESLAVLFG